MKDVMCGRPTPPRFIDKLGQSPVTIEAVAGRNVKLICKVGSKPKPNTSWSKDGEQIRRSKKYFIYRHYLLIKAITPEDAGEYKCDAKNPFGSVTRIFSVTIPGSSDNVASVAKPDVMKEMKEQIEQLKKQVDSLPRNMVNIHMHDGHDDHHHHGHIAVNETRNDHEQHIHLHMHVENDDCHHKHDQYNDKEEIHAHCPVYINSNLEDADDISGHIHLTQKADGPVTLDIHLNGFDMTKENAPMTHGIHIHTYGDLSDSCDSLGPHYNPDGTTHADKHASERHVGDLGNIGCDMNGVIDHQMKDDKISLHGSHSIVGRSIVIHHGPDDLGLGGDAGSQSSGDAGPRVACCVITLANPMKHKHHHHDHTMVATSTKSP